MNVKELLSNVPQAFNYFNVYDNNQLEKKVHVYCNEKRINLLNSMEKEVLDFNLNGENWELAIYVIGGDKYGIL